MVNLREITEQIARALSYAKTSGDAELIVTPLLYPSGSMVLVRIAETPEGFFVSDYGCGAREASMIGDGEKAFRREAKKAADRFGVCFTDDLIFDLKVTRDGLVVAVMAVANASKHAVEHAAMAIASNEREVRQATLWARLDKAFGAGKVEKGMKMQGRSDEWEFDAVIRLPNRTAVFDIVSPSASSANAAIAKFLDVSDLGRTGANCVAVVVDKERTPHLQLVSRNAKILGLLSEPKVYAEAA